MFVWLRWLGPAQRAAARARVERFNVPFIPVAWSLDAQLCFFFFVGGGIGVVGGCVCFYDTSIHLRWRETLHLQHLTHIH